MARKPRTAFVLLISIASLSFIASRTRSNEVNRMENPVDLKLDEASAVKIAEAVFVKVFGERVLVEKPWKVKSEQDDKVFAIQGTLHTTKGGVAALRLRKSNAEVISIAHGK